MQKVMSRDKVAETLDPVEFAAWKLLFLGLVLDTWLVFPNLLWPTAPGSGATYLLPAEPCWHMSCWRLLELQGGGFQLFQPRSSHDEFTIQDRGGIRRFYRWLPRSEMRRHQSLRRALDAFEG